MINFPATLYVYKQLQGEESRDAYPDYTDAEDGDTVAIYRLDKVCRVKHNIEVVLIPESELI